MAGFSTQSIRKAVENLRQLTGEERPLARLMLVISGADIAWRDQEDFDSLPISALIAPGQRLMVLPVGRKHAEILSELRHEVSAAGAGSHVS